MRAYYHDNLPGDRSLPHDGVPSRPAPPEVLQALGWKLFPLDDSESSQSQDPEERLKHFAQQCGFPSESEHFTYDISGTGLLGNPHMTSDEKVDLLTKDWHIEAFDALYTFRKGSGYCDVRDPFTGAVIRVTLSAGDVLLIPAGSLRNYTLDQIAGRDLTILGMFKTEGSFHNSESLPMFRGKEAEQHSSRDAYLSERDRNLHW